MPFAGALCISLYTARGKGVRKNSVCGKALHITAPGRRGGDALCRHAWKVDGSDEEMRRGRNGRGVVERGGGRKGTGVIGRQIVVSRKRKRKNIERHVAGGKNNWVRMGTEGQRVGER